MDVFAGPGFPEGGVRPSAVNVTRREAGGWPRRSKILLAGAAVLALTIGTASRGHAQQEAEPTSVWAYSFYKMITYELFAGLADVSLYYSMLGGTGAAGGMLFGAVNLAASGAVYYVYEVAWNLYGPPIRELPPAEAFQVEVNKTILYRVVDATSHFVVAYAFTGAFAASAGYALASIVIDGLIYAANEYGWYAYGPPVASRDSASLPQPAPEVDVATAADGAPRESAIGAAADAIAANVAAGGTATWAAAESGAAYIASLATTTIGSMGDAYATNRLPQW